MSTRAPNRYHSGSFPFAVDVFLDTYEGPSWVRRKLRGKSGWLQLSRATMVTPVSTWRTTLIAASTDDGELLNAFASSAFLAMRSSGPRELGLVPPDELDAQSEMLFWDFLGTCDLRHLRMLSEAEAERDARVAFEQARGEKVLGEAEAHISKMRRQRRVLDAADERRARLTETISVFEEKQSAAAAWLVRRLASIREEVASLESDVMEALEHHGEVEELYTVHWTAKHPFDRTYSRERSDSFFLGPNPPTRRNATAEARLARDRRFEDESFADRCNRLDLLREERRRDWLERIEERRRQEAEKRMKRDADETEFARWAADHRLHLRETERAATLKDHEIARQKRRAMKLKAVEIARVEKRALKRQLRAKKAARVPARRPDASIDETARELLEQGAVKPQRNDVDEFHDWMKEVGLL